SGTGGARTTTPGHSFAVRPPFGMQSVNEFAVGGRGRRTALASLPKGPNEMAPPGACLPQSPVRHSIAPGEGLYARGRASPGRLLTWANAPNERTGNWPNPDREDNHGLPERVARRNEADCLRGQSLLLTLGGLSSSIARLCVSPGGSRLAVANDDGPGE